MPTSLHRRDVAAMHDVSESEDQGWICAREQTRMGRSNSASQITAVSRGISAERK